ncbi:PD-(D/E)XK nuclease family protein [Rosettibacter firmus]|uniref:PD-(D/E)XK nuclease family protein n=1 Tax=Rosettibacter firmus TaxID=3111522 RepID=UPI00336BE1D8
MILTKLNIEKVDIDYLINEKITDNTVSELLLIVPTNRKVRNLKKDIISLMPSRSAVELNIETLGTFSSKILNHIKPFRQLSEAASIVFIKQCFTEIKPKYFSIYKNEVPFGTLDRIKNVITEYKRHGITPSHLREEAEKLNKSEKFKTLDIADIYEKYINKCYTVNSFDIGDVYTNLLNINQEVFCKHFSSLYREVKIVIITGFNEFTNPEIEIINRLSHFSKIKLYINLDYNENNKLLFSHLDKCYRKFVDLGFKNVEDISESHLPEFRMLIRNELFKQFPEEKKYDYRHNIYKIIGFDRENEVELISKQIKNLIRTENVNPDKICVAFNLIQNYSLIVRDVFSKNGIPFNLTDRLRLDNSNPVKAIINLLEIAENDYYYQNIFRALNSGFINLNNIDLFNLYKISSELKIVSGKENWINIINDHLNNIETYDENDNRKDKIAALTKALEDIKLITTLLEPFEQKQTINQFRENLFNLIIKSGLPLKLLSLEYNQEENIRGFNKFIETINEIFDLLEEEKGKDEKYSLHFFMDQIRTACSWARFNIKEKSSYGVLITNLEEIRGLNFDYLFIGGLCDGDIPTRYNPEIFSTGKFRKQAFIHQTEERNLFYQALNCWNKKLFLSYPLTDNGRETVASAFLKEFDKIFITSEIKENELFTKIYSLEELQVYAGKNLWALNLLQKNFNVDKDHLQKSIDVEKQREENILSESIYNGFLLTDVDYKINIEEILNSFTQKQYSISQLETYALCPFKFFIERVLGIKIIEEPKEEIEAIELGRILHSILFEFYTKIKKVKIDLRNCSNAELENAKELILNIANKKIEQSLFKSPLTFYEKELLTGIDGNLDDSILGKFIEYESSLHDEYEPRFFEVQFGAMNVEEADNELSTLEPIKIDQLKLRGKIDRIELSNNDNSFNIVDYKLSGDKPKTRELKHGISLQLPVYLYAASELLKDKYGYNFTPNEMIIYSLKYSEEEFGKQKISLGRSKEFQSMQELIDNTILHIKNYVTSISKGRFNLSPHDDREKIICRYCQFKPICRIQETL